MKSTSTYPYLSKDTTTLIKAVAILLIIIGHNHLICPNEPEPGMRYRFLYLFHVMVFFILPFFYRPKDRQESLKDQTITIIVRMLVPFVFVYTFCFIVSGLFKGIPFDASTFFRGFFHIGLSVGDGCGFQFPWFLPAFMCFSLIRVFSERYKWLQMLCLTLGLSMYFYYPATQPLEIHYAVKAYFIGFLTFSCYKMWHKQFLHFGSIAFLICTALFFTCVNSGDKFFAIVILMPIMAFCAIAVTPPNIQILTNRSPLLLKGLMYIGRNSFTIYLVHVFIYNATERLLNGTPLAWLTTLLLTITACMLVSEVINRIGIIRRLVMPRNLNEFTHFYKA